MRQIPYCVAISLDGYIAGPSDEFDWIVIDPHIDFDEMSERFDTYFLGRRTFEKVGQRSAAAPGIRTLVFSRSLQQSNYKDVTIVGENWKEVVRSIREEVGKDIWLFAGGSLFRSLAEKGFVDIVEVEVTPIMLWEGIPLVAEPAGRIELTLNELRVYEKTGTVFLVYAVNGGGQP